MSHYQVNPEGLGCVTAIVLCAAIWFLGYVAVFGW